MKRFLLIPVIVVLMAGLIFSGCAKPAPEAITLRLCNGLAPTVFQNTEILPKFKAEVEGKTNGRVTVELYPGGELYGHIDGAEAVQLGAVDMSFSATDHWCGYNPVFGFTLYAFLIKDIPMFQEYEAQIIPIVDPLWEAVGVKRLAFVPYSSVCVATTTLVEWPEDCEGLRIRGMSDPFFHDIEAWGGVPAAMSPDEAYDACAKGALEGIMSSWQSVTARKWYDISDYVFGTVCCSMWGIFMNQEVWEGLPPDVQAVIAEAAKNAHDLSMSGQMAVDEAAREELRGHGMNVKVFTPEEAAIWKDESRSAYAKYVSVCTDAGQGDTAKTILALFGE